MRVRIELLVFITLSFFPELLRKFKDKGSLNRLLSLIDIGGIRWKMGVSLGYLVHQLL